MPSITVHAYDHGATTYAPLPDVWIYWKLGDDVTLLRTDATGLLHQADLTKSTAEPNPAKEMPWVYTADFQTNKGTVVEVAFTRGAKPLPPAQLAADHYTKLVVGNVWPAPFEAPENTYAEECWIGIGAPNAVGWMFSLDILLPNHKSTLTVPHELALWPLLRDTVPTDGDYYTDGLSQGAAIWTGDTNFAGEDEPCAALAAAKRPKERGMRVAGSVETRASGLNLVLLGAAGLPLMLKTAATSTSQVTTFPVTLQDGGSVKTFTADIWFAQSEDAFGPVQIVFQATGASPDYTDAYFVHLAGLQIGLVDDYEANVNGKVPGAPKVEADDRMIVDFRESPQGTLAALQGQTRARRMVPYEMHLRQRPFTPALPTAVLMPEMPLFMAELQLVGLSETRLRELLNFRHHLADGKPDTLEFEYSWTMGMNWDGPDAATNHARSYSYAEMWSNEARAKLKRTDAGELEATITPTPRAVAFPVAGRREPTVRFKDIRRRWNRHAGAAEKDAVLIEWQPDIRIGDREVMRGGDGQITVDTLSIADIDVLPPSSGGAVLQLPRFRMRGTDPGADLDTIIDLVVEEYYDAHSGVAAVTSLTAATWQSTIRAILHHEGRSRQFGFLLRHYGTDADNDNYYGLERRMPLFGYPHGYGLGQLDNPAVTDDGAWSFVDNLRGAVTLLLGAKADNTYALLNQHPADTVHWRACFQRNAIKQYNSGVNEFAWSGGAWKISPNQAQTTDTGAANPQLQYPNLVLTDATDVQYYTGTAAAPVFNWPITFVEANYGDLPD